MDRKDRDDFMFALGQTMEFYGKTIDSSSFKFWYSAMGDRPVYQIKEALLEYVKIGKFAPRPANIMELISQRQPKQRAELPPPPPETSCPPDIAKAWMWFIGRCAQGSENLDGLFSSSLDIDIETQERYLHVVNHEAKSANDPEAIPEEFRLAEVWGGQ